MCIHKIITIASITERKNSSEWWQLLLLAVFEMYFRFNIPWYQLKETMLLATPQNFLNSMNKKFIYRWKSPATSSNQQYLCNGENSSCYQKIARWQLRIVIKSSLIKMSLSLTTSSVNLSLSASSWTILIVLDIGVLLAARVGNGKTLAVYGLYLISGKGDGHLRLIGILRLFFNLSITVVKYCLSTPEIIYYMAAK